MTIDPGSIRYLRTVLPRWYRANRRDLPWRGTSDPYALWVSEIMLQQTRVATVLDYYDRFLDRFPGVDALAAAPVDDVLALWSGLGYYRRARHLKEAAGIVVRRHGGVLPEDEDDLLALPGVGRYTAGAIRSIAFGISAPILDGNVFRVIARFFARMESWSDAGVRDRYWRAAAVLVPRARPGDFNQALMEWGALVCTPAAPACASCPVRRRCGALENDMVAQCPAPRTRPAMRSVRRSLLVFSDGAGRILLRRRPEGGRLGGMWELPEGSGRDAPGAVRSGSFRHSIMNERYDVEVFCASGGEPPCGEGEWTWVAREELGGWPITSMTRKGIGIAAAAATRRRRRPGDGGEA